MKRRWLNTGLGCNAEGAALVATSATTLVRGTEAVFVLPEAAGATVRTTALDLPGAGVKLAGTTFGWLFELRNR